MKITPKTSFPGINANGYIPPDPNIAVGQTYIVQTVNSEVAVFDKSASNSSPMLSGYPKNLSDLFSSNSACSSSNAGDPIVQYDALADSGTGRWLITELASTSSPYGECIAISTSSDPTGSYNVYYQSFGSNLNDYPKFGVWPTATNSAYLASYNLFTNGSSFYGAELCAYDRGAMLSGGPMNAICFTVSNDGGFLPSDLDGANAPPTDAPGYFLNFETTSSLRLYQLTPDFANPSASTLTQVSPDISVTPFSEACGGGTCIPQPGHQKLDSLGDRLMYRLAYRNFGSGSTGHPSGQYMVVNHSVASTNGGVGVRWYELHTSPTGMFDSTSLGDQGTFAPDSNYRWMGSAAMDGAGDIALGYSESSKSIYPEIAVTGCSYSSASCVMNSSEIILMTGAGSQTNYSRWGDYTSLRVDPTSPNTFWYANEYYETNSKFLNYLWSTAIGSFTIAGSSSTSTYPLSVTVSGSGTVTSSPAGIDCSSSTCSASFDSGTPVTLSATPASGWTFAGWSNNSACSGTGTCNVTMSGAESVTATFTQNSYTLSVSVSGSGTVMSSPGGIDCSSGTCSANFLSGTPVTLSATPAGGWTFAGWSNNSACSGTGTCNVTMTAPESVTATFNQAPSGVNFSLSVSPSKLTVKSGSSKSATVTLTSTGGTDPVNLSVVGLPTGVSSGLSAGNPVDATTSGTSLTLTVNVASSVLKGNYPFEVTGTDGTHTQSASMTLSVK